MIESELPEGVFFGRVLLGRFASGLYFIDANRNAKGGIRFLTDLRVCPVILLGSAIDNRIEGRVNFSTFEDILCLLVGFVADGVGVGTGSGDQEIQRLHSGVTGAFGHNIKEFSIRLRVQLIKYHTVDIEAVLTVCLCRQHLIEAVGRLVDDTLLGGQNFYTAIQRRTHTHHISSHVKNDGCLLAVSCTAIDLGTFLTVAAGKQKGHRSGKLGLAHLLRNFHIGCRELSITVGFDGAEDVSDNALLPVNQLKRLTGPCAFGVAEAFYKIDCVIRQFFIVGGVRRHELRQCVVFKFSQLPLPPFKRA